jgi:hypothetical protein
MTSAINSETENFTKNDLVINCRDSKDIAKNYTKTELHH